MTEEALCNYTTYLPDETAIIDNFSSGPGGAIFASLTPGVNIIQMLLVGSGMWKDEATVKSMSRYGDRRL